MLARKISRGISLLRYHKMSQFLWRGIGVAKQIRQRYLPVEYVPITAAVGFRPDAVDRLDGLHARRTQLWPSRSRDPFLDNIVAGRFCFLGHQRDLKKPDGGLDWNPDEPRLWRFHLQCQECLLELAAERGPGFAWQIVASWIGESRHATPFADPDAWHPFCISRRLPVWLMLAARYPPPESLVDEFWQVVSNHVEWLRTHLEIDLGGNHLLENLRALAIAAEVLQGDVRVDRSALYAHVQAEVEEQVLPSGEHFERVPTYHALMMLAVMELAAAAEWAGASHRELASRLVTAAGNMGNHLFSILHPDGQIPLFGDSVLGETPHPQVLCKDVGITVSGDRAESDYWTAGDSNDRLIVDFGSVGCDHLPAHGHADLFTLEASVAGKRLVVDSGTYDYEDSDMRRYCRSTSAHNTSSLGGLDQCDMWSRFRMGRRGHPEKVTRGMNSDATVSWAKCAHSAYRHLGAPLVHRVVLARKKDGFPVRSEHRFDWVIVDFAPTSEIILNSVIHLHPDFTVDDEIRVGDGGLSWLVRSMEPSQVKARIEFIAGSHSGVAEGWYCPDFGHRVRNRVLAFDAIDVARDADNQQLVSWRLCAQENQLRVHVGFESDSLAVTWREREESVVVCKIAI